MGTSGQGNTQSATPPLLGGRYQIVQQLGVGGFGKTFLAQDLHLPGYPQCVVKQLQPDVSSPAELQVARRLFETEATVLGRLGEYPQIPRLLAHFEENEEFYLAQELIEGQDLEDELALGSLWAESQAIAFLRDILSTLAFVHSHRVIHRDIKPANLIRRQQDNRIVLIDFGAVKQVTNQSGMGQTSMGQTICIGTQGYMPAEQVSGHPRFSSDLYAAGMIAIQGITGRYPHTLSFHSQTGEVEWQAVAPHLSPALVSLLSTMVRYDFRDRYTDASSALTALTALSANDSPAHKSTPSSAQDLSHSPAQHLLSKPVASPVTAQTVAVVGAVSPLAARQSPQAMQSDVAMDQTQPQSKRRSLVLPIVAGVGSVAVLAIGILGWQTFPEGRGNTGGNEVTTVTVLGEENAIATVEEFYAAINREDWETARSYFGADLSQQFRAKFFQQFEQVTIEDLRIVDQTPESIELVGQNTYFYPDGSLQKEERTFTLQLIDQNPKIVASEFIAITQRRN